MCHNFFLKSNNIFIFNHVNIDAIYIYLYIYKQLHNCCVDHNKVFGNVYFPQICSNSGTRTALEVKFTPFGISILYFTSVNG